MILPLTGFYAPCSHPKVSNRLTLLAESLPSDFKELQFSLERAHGNRNRCPVPGTLYNMNTFESFKALDRDSLLKKEAKKVLFLHNIYTLNNFIFLLGLGSELLLYLILDDIHSGKVEEDSAVLSRFFIISFADLKKWNFVHWLAFPALVVGPPAMVLNLRPAREVFNQGEVLQYTNKGVLYFLVSIASNSRATIRQLKDWNACQDDGQKLLFGFYDPSCRLDNPGWPLRNYLAFISLRCQDGKIQFLCYREKRGFADLGLSLVGEAVISSSKVASTFVFLVDCRDPQCVPKAVGWEPKPKSINLAESMNPERYVFIRRIIWNPSERKRHYYEARMLKFLSYLQVPCPVLDVCYWVLVPLDVRLLAWGVRKITLLDSGLVAMSNPVRQSLYTLDDCLDGGSLKAVAAARTLKLIFPAVEAEGVTLSIPMPGHPVPTNEVARVLEDCERLRDLIASHDVTFLLTDTRESRWLPALLCASENKVGLFFLMTRKLWASTVTWLCVMELVHSMIHAPGEIANSIMSSSEQPFGILPHQIRGLLPQYSQVTLIGHASNSCTACSTTVSHFPPLNFPCAENVLVLTGPVFLNH
ncbi:hypothetical protein GW17_00034831 [Ensete ventricosum]|nr:hypothetical protein GW17_00034831 [Ensete ventricosum]